MISGFGEKLVYSIGASESYAYEVGDGDFTVAVVAGNHGDEKGAREVFDGLFDELPENYDDLSLSYIPESNVFAYEETSRKTPRSVQPNAADQHDLNRSYETARRELESERNLQGLNTTQRAAFRVLEHLDDLQPDLVIDMHSGTSGTRRMPQVRYKHREDYPVAESSMRSVTENAGVDMVVSEPGEDAEMLGAVAPKMGFPAVTVEVCGGVEHSRDGFTGVDAEDYENIIRNIFAYALDREENDFSPREFTGLEKNFSTADRHGSIEYHFPLGEEVFEGETVATITSKNGETHEMEALEDGALETILTEEKRANVKPGNRIFNIAKRDQ